MLQLGPEDDILNPTVDSYHNVPQNNFPTPEPAASYQSGDHGNALSPPGTYLNDGPILYTGTAVNPLTRLNSHPKHTVSRLTIKLSVDRLEESRSRDSD